MKLYIATIQANTAKGFSEDRLREIVGEEKINEIKKKDPYPYFKAFVVCQEGPAKPRILGKGNRLIKFTKEAVHDVFSKLKDGIKLFHRHGEDNSHKNREELGHVVGATEAVIDGKDSAVFVGYFPQAKKKLAKIQDVCSMEAVWDFLEDAGSMIATGVSELTGISLGRHETEIPAFDGAVALSEVQAFVSEQKEKKMPQETENFYEREGSNEAFLRLRAEARKTRAFPHQIWYPEKMLGERKVTESGLIQWSPEGDREYQSYIEERIIAPIVKERNSILEQLAAKDKEIQNLRRETSAQKVVPMLDKLASERKLSPSILNLAKINSQKISPKDEKEESLLEAATKHIEDMILEHKKLVDSGVIPKQEQTNEIATGLRETESEENPLLKA